MKRTTILALTVIGIIILSPLFFMSLDTTNDFASLPPKAFAEYAKEGVTLLDVRTETEYNAGHIKGAQLMDFYDPGFRTKLSQLPKDIPYFIYCRSGNRSSQVLDEMKKLGFTHVSELSGGIQSWTAHGLPTE